MRVGGPGTQIGVSDLLNKLLHIMLSWDNFAALISAEVAMKGRASWSCKLARRMLHGFRIAIIGLIAIGNLTWFQEPAIAEVRAAGRTGFQLEITRTCAGDANEVLSHIVQRVDRWWDAEHSYSGDASNFSMDLKRACFLEQLQDGGFVRHLEIVHYRPGKELVLSGGLGPLQKMGVCGALSFSVQSSQPDRTELIVLYNVSGFSKEGFEGLAPIVDQVVAGQIDRLQKFCEQDDAP